MPIRIYALAKDLAMENKELVDHCIRVGIKGKGSALASLDDDEAKLVAESLGKTYSPPSHSFIHAPSVAPIASPVSATSAKIERPRSGPERDYVPNATPMSLSSALAIDSLHAQVAEIGAIVESLILKILDTSDTGPTFRGESNFCDLIDAAFDSDVFASLSADDLHSARMARNRIVHRGNGDFPNERELRQSRNAFVLGILDLLEYSGESLKAEVLAEFKQHFPQNKRMHRSGKSSFEVDRPLPAR